MTKCLLPVVLLVATAGVAQTSKKAALIVYGETFSFGVKEPAGWHGDTDAASKFGVNIVFFPADKQSRAADVTIRVRVNKKVDEDTAADLAADMDGYRKEFPSVQFADAPIGHPSYATYSKLFFVPKRFYEYVAYLNPGKDTWFTLSVAMSVKGRPASEDELAALKEVATSLSVLSSPASAPHEFEEALATAERNESTESGAAFDRVVGTAFGQRHQDTLAKCTSDVESSRLPAFNLLMQLGRDGRVERTMVFPPSKVADCVAAAVAKDVYAAPPAEHYWVRVHLQIAP